MAQQTDLKTKSSVQLVTQITTVISKTVVIPIENIDTDQIIPARFLKTTSKEGLGDSLFCDWRYLPDGKPNPDFVLNTPEAQDAHILVAGDNFGCGSSREHAPWALTQFGIKAVISTSFADIFRGNSLKNGLLPIIIPADAHKELLDHPGAQVKIDLESQTVTLPSGRKVEFPIDAFAKHCLMEGVDELGYILKQDEAIVAYESAHPAPFNVRP
jgi:3-isopropylmalate/(R)-2-methylmalate dehydratase small subunit